MIVCSVIRGSPLTLRIASTCSSGSAANNALPTPEACKRNAAPELHDRAHHLAALHLVDEDRLGAIQDREIRGLAGLLHEPAHVRMALRDEIAAREERRADGERLQADVPAAELAGLVDVAHPVERREQPVRRRRRQLDALRDVGEREAAFGARERLEDREAAREALDLRGGVPPGFDGVRPRRGGGEKR